jgi:hypothetical protein
VRRTRRRHDRRRCLRRWYGERLGGDGASVVVGLVARVGASLRCGVGLGRGPPGREWIGNWNTIHGAASQEQAFFFQTVELYKQRF